MFSKDEITYLLAVLRGAQEMENAEKLSVIVKKVEKLGPMKLIGRTQMAAELGFSSFRAFRMHLYTAKPECLDELKREGCIIKSPKPLIKNKPAVKFITLRGKPLTDKEITDLKYFTEREASIIRKHYT